MPKPRELRFHNTTTASDEVFYQTLADANWLDAQLLIEHGDAEAAAFYARKAISYLLDLVALRANNVQRTEAAIAALDQTSPLAEDESL